MLAEDVQCSIDAVIGRLRIAKTEQPRDIGGRQIFEHVQLEGCTILCREGLQRLLNASAALVRFRGINRVQLLHCQIGWCEIAKYRAATTCARGAVRFAQLVQEVAEGRRLGGLSANELVSLDV